MNKKMQEITNKTTEQLRKELLEMEAARAQMQFDVFSGALRNVRKLRATKRGVARLHTELCKRTQASTLTDTAK